MEIYKKGCFFINNKSPNWELNPGPSVYKTDALPLSYLGMHQPGIEPGAPAWQAGILPLNHWYAKRSPPI